MPHWKTFEHKIKVLQNKSRLREERVYIESDLTEQERSIQFELRKLARDYRNDGKQVKVGYKKLIVEG